MTARSSLAPKRVSHPWSKKNPFTALANRAEKQMLGLVRNVGHLVNPYAPRRVALADALALGGYMAALHTSVCRVEQAVDPWFDSPVALKTVKHLAVVLRREVKRFPQDIDWINVPYRKEFTGFNRLHRDYLTTLHQTHARVARSLALISTP